MFSIHASSRHRTAPLRLALPKREDLRLFFRYQVADLDSRSPIRGQFDTVSFQRCSIHSGSDERAKNPSLKEALEDFLDEIIHSLTLLA